MARFDAYQLQCYAALAVTFLNSIIWCVGLPCA